MKKICVTKFKKDGCTYNALIEAVIIRDVICPAPKSIPIDVIQSAEIIDIILEEYPKELEEYALKSFKGDECE